MVSNDTSIRRRLVLLDHRTIRVDFDPVGRKVLIQLVLIPIAIIVNKGVMGSLTMNPLFRSESFGHYPEQNYSMIEKRQLFLRSYQFSRKKSLTERIKGSMICVKKVVWLRLSSARKFVISRFKCAFYHRRRRFSKLLNRKSSDSSYCFW
ncbi:hypothetical protein RIF29_22234 [Crotalaria pallida]|uniref:Uncharacterized protein n=1 Tax=Crotalaria pallida TaxID=3830 RepID=A0AAN9F8V3_CROPI